MRRGLQVSAADGSDARNVFMGTQLSLPPPFLTVALPLMPLTHISHDFRIAARQTPVQEGWVYVDDDDYRIEFSYYWLVIRSVPQAYDNTMHSTTVQGATATLTFTGSYSHSIPRCFNTLTSAPICRHCCGSLRCCW